MHLRLRVGQSFALYLKKIIRINFQTENSLIRRNLKELQSRKRNAHETLLNVVDPESPGESGRRNRAIKRNLAHKLLNDEFVESEFTS